MSFGGYLINIGGSGEFLNKYIIAASYKVSKKILDLDSARDADGVLHRNALDHISYTIQFETKPMDNDRMQTFLGAIRNHWDVKERKVDIQFWNPEMGTYSSSTFYMPDPEFQINHIEHGQLFYDKATIKFIGY